jgi:hypothetical protein
MGSRPSSLHLASKMSDSESMANKENTVCETQVEDHTMLDLTDKPASGTVDITTPTKKNPTYEKFVRMKMRAKKISQVIMLFIQNATYQVTIYRLSSFSLHVFSGKPRFAI